MQHSIIQKSQLEGALRLDAEYYQPEYLENAKRISTLPYEVKKFSDLASYITNGHTPLHADLSIGEVYFLTAEDIFDFFINYETAKRITKLASTRELKRTILSNNDLLVTIKGRIGNAAVVYKLQQETNINQDVARIVVKKGVNPFYIAAFLNSRFGKLQIERIATNQINPFLGLGNLRELLIPVIEQDRQQEIENLIKRGLDELEVSKHFYSQAEDLLLEELGLEDFKVEEDLSYIVNLSEIKSAHRADAEYFQPKYEKIISKIKYKMERLSNLLLSKGGTKKGIEIGSEQYQEEGKLFIRVSNLSKQGLVERDQKYLSEELYQKLKKDFEPKVGEILLTKDATPGIAYLLKEPVEGIIAGGILRLKVKPDINPEYLVLVINSIVGQMQVEKDTGGSVIFHWRPDQIKNLLIPILPKPTQQKIADLVQKSHEARKKAKQLLSKAKRKVEKLIEKN